MQEAPVGVELAVVEATEGSLSHVDQPPRLDHPCHKAPTKGLVPTKSGEVKARETLIPITKACAAANKSAAKRDAA